MPLPEVCRCAEVLDAAPLPCVTCRKKLTCAVLLLHERLQRAQVASPEHKRSVISACSGYVRAGDDQPHTVDVTASLARADVRHLCDRCPEAGTGSCEEQRGLGELRRMAAASDGIDVTFTVFTCRTKGRVLLPISQPGEG